MQPIGGHEPRNPTPHNGYPHHFTLATEPFGMLPIETFKTFTGDYSRYLGPDKRKIEQSEEIATVSLAN
jgi:hypothetical protein